MSFNDKLRYRKLLLLLIAMVELQATEQRYGNRKKNNILFVVVDDLRHLSETIINLQNLNSLAGNGINFKNAFAQQSLCAPSRNSMLTGRRPDSLHLYDFYSYWRNFTSNFTTIPQFFKERGYQTYSVGKVFHPGASSNFTDDFPLSWSQSPYHPPSEKFKDSKVCNDRQSRTLKSNLICPVNLKEQPGNTLPDLEILEYALEIIKKNRYENSPYFLAVGFHKPHIPLKYPKEYLGRVPLSNVSAPKTPYMPKGMPTTAWHPWNDVRKRDDIHRLNIPYPYGTMPRKWSRKIRRSYLAASLYIDDLIGILMGAVDFNSTIVVFVSDHGWSLGENGLWAKYSNFDVALRVPLILSVPWLKSQIIQAPVELIDIFPTLLELTNNTNAIPKCNRKQDTNDLCLEGKSLVSLLGNYSEENEPYVAISQYPRPSVKPRKSTDKPRLRDIHIMGYSLRTNRYRYTEWIAFNHTTFTKNWNKNYGTELYDHYSDPLESNNLYPSKKHLKLVDYLSKLLRSKV